VVTRGGKDVTQCAKTQPCNYPLELPAAFNMAGMLLCGPQTTKYLEMSIKAAVKAIQLSIAAKPKKVPYECIMQCVNVFSKMSECSELTSEYYATQSQKTPLSAKFTTLVKSCMNEQSKGLHTNYNSYPSQFVQKRKKTATISEYNFMVETTAPNAESFCIKHTPSPGNAARESAQLSGILNTAQVSKLIARAIGNVSTYKRAAVGSISCRSSCQGVFKTLKSGDEVPTSVEKCVNYCDAAE